jgi:hypothetical protein
LREAFSPLLLQFPWAPSHFVSLTLYRIAISPTCHFISCHFNYLSACFFGELGT